MVNLRKNVNATLCMAKEAKMPADKASNGVVKLKAEVKVLKENSVTKEDVVKMTDGKLSQAPLKTVDDSVMVLF